jgi:hypothetical protein
MQGPAQRFATVEGANCNRYEHPIQSCSENRHRGSLKQPADRDTSRRGSKEIICASRAYDHTRPF